MFSIVRHVDDLESGLRTVNGSSKIAFALWCGDEIVKLAFEDLLKGGLAPRVFEVFSELSKIGWGALLGVEEFDRARMLHLKKLINDSEWITVTELMRNENDIYLTNTIRCLSSICETCLTGMEQSAADAAEQVFNFLNYKLGQEFGESSTERVFSDSRMVSLLARQRAMVKFLANI